MKISLSYNELLFDITNKNRSEVQGLDPAVRYRAEIGSDKDDEVRRCLMSSLSVLTANYTRFVQDASVTPSDNELSLPETIEIRVNGSERRLAGKMSAIANCMHAILVNMTLSQFYLSVGQSELSSMRDNVAATEVQVLKKLFYSKIPPCVC